MKRRIFDIAAGMSLLACIGICWLWHATAEVPAVFPIGPPMSPRFQFVSGHGAATIEWYHVVGIDLEATAWRLDYLPVLIVLMFIVGLWVLIERDRRRAAPQSRTCRDVVTISTPLPTAARNVASRCRRLRRRYETGPLV